MNDKNIKIDVVDKDYKKLAPTNLMVAKTLVARDKAIWIEYEKKLILLKTKKDFKIIKNKIIQEEGRVCYICKIIIPKEEHATIDHVNPKSRLGKDDRWNLHCCCKRCNDDKGNRTYEEYMDYVKKNICKYKYLFKN